MTLHDIDHELFESPCQCADCGVVFDSEQHFITKPYRPVCPACGQVQSGAEPDWKSYAGY